MVPIDDHNSARSRAPGSAGGFTLIEVLIATLVLTVGLLSLVGVMAVGLQSIAQSSSLLIAREKAREAVESVHTARDTGELAWTRIRNVVDGGSFLDGPRDLRLPGPDGLVNTSDDVAGAAGIEKLRGPGADGILNNADDTLVPLSGTLYQREIRITALTLDGSAAINPNLRRILVTVSYRILGSWRTYTLTTFVSAYS